MIKFRLLITWICFFLHICTVSCFYKLCTCAIQYLTQSYCLLDQILIICLQTSVGIDCLAHLHLHIEKDSSLKKIISFWSSLLVSSGTQNFQSHKHIGTRFLAYPFHYFIHLHVQCMCTWHCARQVRGNKTVWLE